jgi:RNA polymerase sigma factor (sigma-70 family)
VIDVAAGGETPFDRAAALERARIVASAIAALSDRQRLLIVLRYRYDLSFSAIGTRLEISAPAAHHLHARAIARIAEHLADRSIHGMDAI